MLDFIRQTTQRVHRWSRGVDAVPFESQGIYGSNAKQQTSVFSFFCRILSLWGAAKKKERRKKRITSDRYELQS